MTDTEIRQLPADTKLIVRPWKYGESTIVATLGGFEANGAIRVMSRTGSYHYLSADQIDGIA